MKKVQRCGLYIRVSTAEQCIHGKSLEAQREFLTRYAEEHDMIPVGIYADEGKTARKELKKRKAVQSLLDDVKAGKLDVILFWRLDRWFRNMSDFYKVQEILDRYGVRWISASEPGLNMETRDGRLQLNVILSIGQNEVDTTSERIKFVNESSIRQGKAIFGNANMPRGYKIGFSNGKKCMIKDPEQAEMVNAFFDYFEMHQSKQGTLRFIRRNYDPDFTYSMLRTMLSSEFYKGTYRGIPYCPAYLSEERWKYLQQLSHKNIRYAPSGRIYYFSGMILCPVCGNLLCATGCKAVVNRKTGEKRDYCYYRCNRAAIDHTCTNRQKLSQDRLEQYLLRLIADRLKPYKINVTDIRKNNNNPRSLQRGKNNPDQELKRLNLLFQKGRISLSYYEREYDRLQKEQSVPPSKAPVPPPDLSSLKALLQTDPCTIYSFLSRENRRVFWRNTIRQIHIHPDKTIKSVNFY